MIELYFLVTLAAIGFMVNTTQNKKTVVSYKNKLPKSSIPSVNNIYDAHFYKQSEAITANKVKKMFDASSNPVKTGVISRDFAYEKDQHMAKKVKSLTGEYIDETSFLNKNVQPYFGGRMRQNLDPHANSTRLEAFTGNSQDSLYKQKCEVASFFDTTKDVTNVNGMGNQDDFYRDRMVVSRVRNNETPVEKVYVGPGLNKGYDSKPTGGFQQFDAQDYAKPKCVDELRAANKPKMTFEGRTLDGMKSKMRGDIGKVDKNRPDTYFIQTEDMLLKTTGARLKPSEIPVFNVKHTNRVDTTTEYTGTAISANAKARVADPNVRQTNKYQYGEYGLRNAALQMLGKGERDDFGKSKIMVFANERDITTTRVYQGNLTSLIKAIVAPVTDLFKDTKKDEFVDNPRHFGNMNAQFPDKPTMYDPNDTARTTIKETMVHESINGNLKGAEKTTIYDPNDTARTTLKETTVHESINGNLRGDKKLTIYDPNDIARTTIKETMIHDEIGTGTLTGAKQLFVYDPDEIAKRTMRETLERMEYEMNLSGGAKKGTIYDPDDSARTTMKETLEDAARDGNIDRVEGMGDYNTTDFDPRKTQKQFVSDNDYYGTATRNQGEGYQTNEFDAKNTQKQFLSDIEYYGNAEASTDKKQKSYEDMYNANISSGQESLIYGREPTNSGKKEYVTGDSITLGHRKQECDIASQRVLNNIDKINSSHYADLEENGITRMKKEYGRDDRLDPSLLKAYLENPYTKPLNSVA